MYPISPENPITRKYINNIQLNICKSGSTTLFTEQYWTIEKFYLDINCPLSVSDVSSVWYSLLTQLYFLTIKKTFWELFYMEIIKRRKTVQNEIVF